MSKRHTALSRERGGLHVLKQDEIWDAAKDVWNTLPNCKIASAYVSAYNISVVYHRLVFERITRRQLMDLY